jgi:hypothetical protein
VGELQIQAHGFLVTEDELAFEQISEEVRVRPAFAGGALAGAIELLSGDVEAQALEPGRGFGLIGDAHGVTCS